MRTRTHSHSIAQSITPTRTQSHSQTHHNQRRHGAGRARSPHQYVQLAEAHTLSSLSRTQILTQAPTLALQVFAPRVHGDDLYDLLKFEHHSFTTALAVSSMQARSRPRTVASSVRAAGGGAHALFALPHAFSQTHTRARTHAHSLCLSRVSRD